MEKRNFIEADKLTGGFPDIDKAKQDINDQVLAQRVENGHRLMSEAGLQGAAAGKKLVRAMLHPKHERIKNHLSDGFTVRQTAKLLHVAPGSVQAVRAMYPELFPPRPVGTAPAPVRLPSVVVFSRIAQDIYQGFKSEMEKRGLDRSAMLRFILNERYQPDANDRLNNYELQTECSCPSGSIVKNHNSNLDGDQFICDRCGRVRDIIGG